MSNGEELKRLRADLEEARKRLEERAEEIGRMRGEVERAEKVERERDELRASLESRVAEAVKSAVGELSDAHAKDEAEWQEERERLQAEIDRLEGTPDALREQRPPVPVDTFADGMRQVLDSFAEPEPVEGRQGAAALSGLEVEARGVLLPGESAGKSPEFLTVDPTQVASEALSTLRMRFVMLPQLPREPPG
jgi:hypothetical protein